MQHRRTAYSAALAAAALVSLAACSSGSGDAVDPDADISKQSLTVGIWADYYPEDLAQRFEDATGVPVTIVNHATNEEAVAKVTAGGDSGIDVLFVSGQYAQALNEQGLLEPLEKSLIPNEANLYPEASELAYDPGNTFSLPYAWGTTGLCYRPDLTGYDPTSWMDLLEPRPEVAGKTTMLATERWLALPALKAQGHSVNSENPADLEEAKEQLLKTKSTLLAYDDTTFYDKLITGEASLVEAWDGWCNYAIAEAPQTKFVLPEEGSDLWVDTMTVLKSSKNKEAAMAFLNFILEPEQGAWVADNILYKVPNKAAMDSLDPALLEQYPNLAMTPEELAKGETIVDLGEFSTEYTRLVTEVTAG